MLGLRLKALIQRLLMLGGNGARNLEALPRSQQESEQKLAGVIYYIGTGIKLVIIKLDVGNKRVMTGILIFNTNI